MKELLITLIAIFLFGGSMEAQTYKMKIVKKDGEIIVVPVTSIEQVSYVKDGENDGGGSYTSSSPIKQIIGVTDSGDNCTFEYDAMGRVIKANNKTYTYSEKAIFVNGHQEYVLSNGRIVKEENYEAYAYDSNGYLKEQSGEINFTFTWKDGNLIKYGNKNDYFTITYSNLEWPKGWMHYWKWTDMDSYLEPSGAWGKMPNNLPAVITQYDSDGLYRTISYEYSVENGRITQLIETVKYHSSIVTESYVYRYAY